MDGEEVLTDILEDPDLRARDEYERQQRIVNEKVDAYMQKVHAKESKMLVIAMFDATSSMGSTIKKTSAAYIRLMRALKNTSDGFVTLPVGIRDPVDDPDGSPHETAGICDVSELKMFMTARKAYGGGDVAEDHAGAMELCIATLNEELAKDPSLRNRNVLLSMVMDAPAHGYSDGRGDNHNTDLQRDRLSNALGGLLDLLKTFESFQSQVFTVGDCHGLRSFVEVIKRQILRAFPSADPEYIFGHFHPTKDFGDAMMKSTFNSVVRSRVQPGLDIVVPTTTTPLDHFKALGVDFTLNTSTPSPSEVEQMCVGPPCQSIRLLNVMARSPVVPTCGKTTWTFVTQTLANLAGANTYHDSHYFHSLFAVQTTTRLTYDENVTKALVDVAHGRFGQGGERHAVRAHLTYLTREECDEMAAWTRMDARKDAHGDGDGTAMAMACQRRPESKTARIHQEVVLKFYKTPYMQIGGS